MTHSIIAARIPAALLLGLLFSMVGSPLFSQPLPTETPLADQTRLTPEEIARFQKKKAINEHTERIRKALVSRDYDAVLKEVDEARKIDPNNPVLTLYRKIAEEKKLGVPVGKALRTPRGMTPTVEPSTSGALETASLRPPALPSPTATPVAQSSPTPAGKPESEMAVKPSNKPRLFAGIASLAALALAFAAYKKFTAHKKAGLEGEEEEESQEEVQVFEPKGLSMSTLALNNADHAHVNPEDMAANIAESIGSMPSSTSVPPPSFDFVPLHADGLESENHDLPTTLDVPDHEEQEEDIGDDNIVLPPDLDERIPIAESKPQAPAIPPKPVVPAEPKPTFSDSVSFEDLGISFASDDDDEPPPAKPAPRNTEPVAAEPYKYAPEVVETPTPTPTPAPAPAQAQAQAQAPQYTNSTDSIALPGMFEPEAPKADPAKPPLGAINLGDVLSTASTKTPAQPPRQQPPEPTSSMQLDTVSFALPSLDDADETRSIPSAAPAPVADQDDSISLGDTITLDFLSETQTSVTLPVPPPSSSAIKPMEERDLSETSSMPSIAPAGTADERSERMFKEQRAHGMQAYEQKNWKQAVHYLSIAAAIHPEDDELRVRLREAREQKRREEAGA